MFNRYQVTLLNLYKCFWTLSTYVFILSWPGWKNSWPGSGPQATPWVALVQMPQCPLEPGLGAGPGVAARKHGSHIGCWHPALTSASWMTCHSVVPQPCLASALPSPNTFSSLCMSNPCCLSRSTSNIPFLLAHSQTASQSSLHETSTFPGTVSAPLWVTGGSLSSAELLGGRSHVISIWASPHTPLLA